ncbi:type VI secretion system baseplate subunit TssE [Burkholderia sp. Ac-20344]|uniref:type VI secretion system baseplate subunit TssE n=1 Tax=Burkholderia sp. Ac-20344 TaxID=2703890 RepID=UPI00197CA805|nr:type VI secretion system baseplate subunit TssE [Burkholderia sp. Ac-20344]MBN3830781.1 type VI secretion system baseplate subunit TssE [Burkholderia sp. Ac-20344]
MWVGPGLFERVTGHFADGATVDEFSPETQVFLSVRDNIERILNSRRGSLAHLPDYGLDDLSEIYRHLPSSAHTLRQAIEVTLLKYEPRLKKVDVDIHSPEPGMLLSFTMACHLRREGLVRFGTNFMPDGKTRLTILPATLNRY